MMEQQVTMRAAVYLEPGVIEVREVPRPAPQPGEVLIKVRAAGICGSDMHIFTTGRLGSFTVTQPMIMGHEMSGEVEALGDGVTTLSVGQRVVVEPGMACGNCHYCRSGRYNLCPDVKFMGQPAKPGAMAEYVTAPAQWVFPLPDRLGFLEGALAEPLVVALEAMEKGKVGIESRVAIFGGGPIGLLALQAARARGARQVFVVDVLDSRLSMAREMGATAALNPMATDPVAEIRALSGGGADVVIELSGAPKAIGQMFRSAAKGAMAVLVGLTDEPEVGLAYTDIVRSGVRIETVFRYVNQFAPALDLLDRGLIDWKPLVTHTFPLEEAPAAFALIRERKAEVVKAMLTMP